MHIYTASHRPVALDLLSSSLATDPAGRLIVRVGSETAAVTGAVRAFFEMGVQRGAVRAQAARRETAPSVFRERRSGLLRVVYREAVIRFQPKTPSRTRRAIIEKHGFAVRRGNPFVPDQVVVYDPANKRTGAQMLRATNDWAEMDEVRFATPNFVSQFRRGAPPGVPREQWHLRNTGRYAGQRRGEDVDAREAWQATRGRRSVVVAVLDDGVDVDHPNLKANVLRHPDPDEPRDVVGRDFFVADDHPDHFNPRPKRFQYPYQQMTGNDIHGTPCAGVIAASGADPRACGVAPRCRILAVKVFHADDLASDARVADAIRYAALHADILSCSWSGGQSPDIELAIEDAGTLGRGGKGAAVFCAAGNDYGAPVAFPASHAEAVAVGASTDRATLAAYSNVGPELWVVAPSSGGVRGIFTTDVSQPGRGFNVGASDAGGKDGLHTNDFGGTSSATPLAAGVAALVLSRKPSLDRAALKQVLAKTADHIGSGYGSGGHSPRFGHGRVNAGKAVNAV